MGRRIVPLVFLFLVIPALQGQDLERPVALAPAHIWVGPEESLESGGVLIQRGLIEDVFVAGARDFAPQTELIDFSENSIYPIFIDGFSHLGIVRSEVSEKVLEARRGEIRDRSQGPSFGMDDAPEKGFFPTTQAAHQLATSKTERAKWRRAGFGLVHVAPKRGFVCGTGALLTLSDRPHRERFVDLDGPLYISMRSGGDGYPSTTIGRMAYLRQIFLDTQSHARAWEEESTRRRRPVLDPGYRALEPAGRGEQPVLFWTQTENDIHRALDLGEEFNLDVWLVGAAEAGRVVDRLAHRQRPVPIFLTLDWPEEPTNPDDPEAKPKPEDEDLPLRARQERYRLWVEQAQASLRLAEAGVPFALTLHGLKSPKQFLKRAHRLVEWGLEPEILTQALTSHPAQWFGVESTFGSLRPGSPASLVVLSHPLGAAKAKVRRIYIDGYLYDLEQEAEDSSPPPDEGVDLTGSWELDLQSEATTMSAVLELAMTENGELGGSVTSPMGPAVIEKGRVSGREFQMTLSITLGDEQREIEIEGRLTEEGTLAGTIRSEWDTREIQFEGSRPNA